MGFNSNTFMQNNQVGFCDRENCCYFPIPVVVGDTIGNGEPVSLADTTKNTLPKVVPVSDGITFGFTFIHAHKNYYVAGDCTDILPVGSKAIIYLNSGSAISSGDLLSYDGTTKTVNTATNGDQIIGQALIAAVASGELIPVYLNQPYGKSVEPVPTIDLTGITEIYRGDDE